MATQHLFLHRKYTAMKLAIQLLPLVFALSFPLLSDAQTLRGTVRDADHGEALTGATVALRYSRGEVSPLTLATSPAGEYVFEKIRPGYYTISFTAQGFESQTIVEVNVAAGKEQVLDIALRPSTNQLEEVTILAYQPGDRAPMPLGEIPLTRDQTLRFPAMFFDPGRLASAYPGVAQTDDGTNSLSIRGNSPASVRWRLEGVDIVNPNHLPNAGTFSDRPAAASGGVLMFSAQLLDNSSLLTGPMPAGYGDALGGVMDMNLRKGNNQQHEFTAQAGLVGLDLAAEGPLGPKGKSTYLANYRYSTVGLLGQLGVSFGDEQINFQDFSFNLHFDGLKGGRWSVFGLGGLSENIFRHKTDTAEIKSYKDFFDIDFQSKTGVLGVSNWSPLWKNAWVKMSLAASGQTTERSASSPAYLERSNSDDIQESKLSGSISYIQRLGRQIKASAGVNLTRQVFEATSLQNKAVLDATRHDYLLVQPWANVSWNSLNGKTSANLGLHNMTYKNPYGGGNAGEGQVFLAEPRVILTHLLAKSHRISASAGLYSQMVPQWVLQSAVSYTQSEKYSLAYQWLPSTVWSFKVEAFQQQVNRDFYSADSRTLGFSLLNVSEFLPQGYQQLIPLVTGSNSGLEFSAERRLMNGWFLLANTTLLKSRYKIGENKQLPSRWDIGHVANVTFGKEWQREKRPGKERTIGLNARGVWTGGVREPEINLIASMAERTTVYDETKGYFLQSADYFRLDLRVYWRKNLGNRRNSTFALDLQNLSGQQNLAYHYYDPYTNKIEEKFQLGTIPNFSWKLEF